MKHRTVVTMTAAAGLATGQRPIRAPSVRMVVLRDGSAVLIRQVRSADAPLLADGFARLSSASRQMRFLGVKKELSAAELRYLTDVDHYDHEALAALDQAGGHGVGIGRYIRDADDPQAAEIAVTIVDDWQGRGLGTVLLAQLSDRARQGGIRRFTALADAGNVAVAALLRNAGACLVRRGRGTVEYEITLARGAESSEACVCRSTGQAASGPISAVGSPGPERVCALSRSAPIRPVKGFPIGRPVTAFHRTVPLVAAVVKDLAIRAERYGLHRAKVSGEWLADLPVGGHVLICYGTSGGLVAAPWGWRTLRG